MNFTRRSLVALLLAATPLAYAQPQSGPRTVTAAREAGWQAITNGHGSGVAVAVMDKGKLVFSEGMGVREWGRNNPVDSHTRFNIGSTSKMFLAVAVLMLVDEGKISLDESLAHYLPEFQMADPRYKAITVRMIFNHSSGLPGSSFHMGFRATHDAHKFMLDTLRSAHLKHAPGAMSMYCNDGFTLGEMVVERVSQQKYLDFLRQRIFDPLDMRDSGASVGELAGDADIADYVDPKAPKVYPAEVMEVYAAGGLSSTVEDLCRFGNSFTPYGKHLLSPASLQEILRTQPTRFSDKLRKRQAMTEFGWDYSNLSPYDQKGIQVVGKGGNTACYSTNLQIVPEQGLVLAFCISGHAWAENVTRPILQGLLEDHQLIASQPEVAQKPPTAQEIPAEFSQFSGIYCGEATGAVKVAISKDRRRLTVQDLETSETVANLSYSQGLFWNSSEHLRCYFRSVDGKNYLVRTPAPGGKDYASIYQVDSLMFQQLSKVKHPPVLANKMNQQQWLARNAPPFENAETLHYILTSHPVPIDGYIQFGGVKRIESPTFASIAATSFRDQAEVNFLPNHWARLAGILYSPAPLAPAATRGVNSLEIGSDGYNQWLECKENSLVKIDTPADGRALILDRDGKMLFDSLVDSQEVLAPRGSRIVCAGPVASRFSITRK